MKFSSTSPSRPLLLIIIVALFADVIHSSSHELIMQFIISSDTYRLRTLDVVLSLIPQAICAQEKR